MSRSGAFARSNGGRGYSADQPSMSQRSAALDRAPLAKLSPLEAVALIWVPAASSNSRRFVLTLNPVRRVTLQLCNNDLSEK